MNTNLSAFEVTLLLGHLAATWFLVGLIWMVQRVTYPAFAHAAGDGRSLHRHHTRSIGPVVGPVMAVEAVAAVLLVVPGVAGVPTWLALAGLAALGIVQASTAFLQVPAHQRLEQGMEEAEIGRIVRTNWIRTIGWSVRGLLAIWMVLVAG